MTVKEINDFGLSVNTAANSALIQLVPMAQAARHVELLFGDQNKAVHFRAIFPDAKREAQFPAKNLSGRVKDLWREFERLQTQGYGIFVVVNEGGQLDDEITAVTANFIDADDVPMPSEWHLAPSFMVVRDETHWHAYWRATPGRSASDFKLTQKRLAKHYGTDPIVSNPSRVMRLAGTRHTKNLARPVPVALVDMVGVNFDLEGAYSQDEITTGLPELPKPVAAVSAPEVELDSPNSIARAVAFLEAEVRAGNVAVEKAGGNNRTYATAATVLDFGVSAAKGIELLETHWYPHCIPNTKPQFLERIFEHVSEYRQNKGAPLAVAPAAEVFAETVAKFPNDAPELLSGDFIPFADLLKREVQPVQELVPGLIEKGVVTFLAGHGGTHKSRTAVHWGLSIAAGRPIYGREVERASFVCISCEDGIDEVTRRVQAMANRLNLPIGDNAHLWDRRGIVSPLATVTDSGIRREPFWDQLKSRLQAIEGHKFIVVDSAYNVLNFTGATKSSEGPVKAAIELLGQLCAETDSTMIVLWHPSRAGQERGDNSGWSVAWDNAPRARLSLTRVPDMESAFDLKVEKRNNAPPQKLPLTLRWDDGVLLPITEVAATERKALFKNACINTALQAADGGCPIQKQRRIQGWMFDQIEKDAGYRPTEKQVKDELAAAISTGELRYIAAHGKQQAGYFAKERDPFLIKNRIPEAKHPG